MARQKDTPEIAKFREFLTNTITKLDAAESKMVRAFHEYETLRAARKRYERKLAVLLAGQPG